LTAKAKIDRVQKIPYGAKKRDAWRKLDVEIGGNNRAGIDRADMVLAVLDGVDVDSGTAAEIGYAFAKGKPILGYRGDFRLSADNEGAMVNLQVEYFIRQSGGDIVTKVADLGPALAKLKAVATKRLP
jgi:nucleoside 2-deoxyribosyltransferase